MLENYIKFSIKNNLWLLVILMNFIFGYFKNKKPYLYMVFIYLLTTYDENNIYYIIHRKLTIFYLISLYQVYCLFNLLTLTFSL